MGKRERVQLSEPSRVLVVKHSGRSTEKLLLEADGINAMCSPDGSVTIEAYTDDRSIVFRMTPEDAKAQAHVFRNWRNLK